MFLQNQATLEQRVRADAKAQPAKLTAAVRIRTDSQSEFDRGHYFKDSSGRPRRLKSW